MTHFTSHLRSGLFPLGGMAKILYEFLLSPTHATLPAYVELLDFITLIIFDEDDTL
jgi:hypothetical protein